MNPRTPWKDGVLLMVCNLFVAIGNYAFQGLIGRKLSLPEYGYANAAAGAVLLLSLPVMATSNALIHYVARFRASGQKSGVTWIGVQHTQMARLHSRERFSSGLVVDSSAHRLLRISANESDGGGDGDKHGRGLGTVFVTALCTGMGWYPGSASWLCRRNRKARYRLGRHQSSSDR